MTFFLYLFFFFQINREKDVSGSTESQMWVQPKVKLERLGLVRDFEKRPKPVVVLKKLSVDQIQRIIRHSKSGKNRFSSKSSKSKNICIFETVYISFLKGFHCSSFFPFFVCLLRYLHTYLNA